ncbi:hypothetical protein CSAL01_05594 [Colletotrichum salicis]|uniref:Uncharacterized protein n=1 Tax=Colletotrichum salicis TaxID=1209931 RepID=A0A135U6D1_9PEZI|nr:hypothetical protein CSAL01_05594 [Colletotrichum salicis]
MSRAASVDRGGGLLGGSSFFSRPTGDGDGQSARPGRVLHHAGQGRRPTLQSLRDDSLYSDDDHRTRCMDRAMEIRNGDKGDGSGDNGCYGSMPKTTRCVW